MHFEYLSSKSGAPSKTSFMVSYIDQTMTVYLFDLVIGLSYLHLQ